MKALLIINPTAGRPKDSPVDQIAQAFKADGRFLLEVHQTSGPGDATVTARKAAQSGYDLVVAAGGDGSIFEVANGLVHTSSSLGVVPIGTENVLAREMGVPLDPSLAARHMLDRPPRTIDTGCLGGQHFVCFAGIGFDAHVAHRLPSVRKKRFGALAYFLTSAEKLAAYKRSLHSAKITLDGETLETEFFILVISNIRSYGGGLIPAPQAVVDDGLLDVCIFPKANYLQIMRQMAATTKGKHVDLPGVRYLQAAEIQVETEPNEQVQLDGEAWPGTSPFNFKAVPRSLSVRF